MAMRQLRTRKSTDYAVDDDVVDAAANCEARGGGAVSTIDKCYRLQRYLYGLLL